MQNILPHFPHWIQYLLPLLVGLNVLGTLMPLRLLLLWLDDRRPPLLEAVFPIWGVLVCTVGQLCVIGFWAAGQADAAALFGLLPGLTLLAATIYWNLGFKGSLCLFGPIAVVVAVLHWQAVLIPHSIPQLFHWLQNLLPVLPLLVVLNVLGTIRFVRWLFSLLPGVVMVCVMVMSGWEGEKKKEKRAGWVEILDSVVGFIVFCFLLAVSVPGFALLLGGVLLGTVGQLAVIWFLAVGQSDMAGLFGVLPSLTIVAAALYPILPVACYLTIAIVTNIIIGAVTIPLRLVGLRLN